MIWITPHASDWDNIAQITGDTSWASSNMQQYLRRVYQWLPTASIDPALLVQDDMLAQHLAGGAAVVGHGPDPLAAAKGLEKTLRVDPNNTPGRDSLEGFYQIPMTQVRLQEHMLLNLANCCGSEEAPESAYETTLSTQSIKDTL